MNIEFKVQEKTNKSYFCDLSDNDLNDFARKTGYGYRDLVGAIASQNPSDPVLEDLFDYCVENGLYTDAEEYSTFTDITDIEF